MPLTRSWADKTQEEVQGYNSKIGDIQHAFRHRPMFMYDTGPKVALEQMDEAVIELQAEMEFLEQKASMCSIFGFPELISVSRDRMNEMFADIKLMRVVWKVTADLDTFILRKKDELWRERDMDSMEDGTKAQLKVVKGLPREVAWADCYRAINQVL